MIYKLKILVFTLDIGSDLCIYPQYVTLPVCTS